MRYERKYRIQNLSFESVNQELIWHPAGFRAQFSDRRVHSIYFDDASFELAQATLSGVSNRCKYRIRWYGENAQTVKQPIFESKIKKNKLGYKEFKPLPPLKLENDFRLFCDQNIPNDLAIFPVVYISYLRTYLLSFDHKVRVTIDRSIQCKAIENYRLNATLIADDVIVLEFKYEQEHAQEAEDMMAALPFRLGKNSKYVNAIQSLYF